MSAPTGEFRCVLCRTVAEYEEVLPRRCPSCGAAKALTVLRAPSRRVRDTGPLPPVPRVPERARTLEAALRRL